MTSTSFQVQRARAGQCGYTAALLSGCRPNAPILAIRPNERVRKQISLYGVIKSLVMQMANDIDAMVASAGR